MRLAGYVRVSTRAQELDGLGRPDQERKIRAWARRNGHTLCGAVCFDQVTGKTPVEDRPGFVEALNRITEGRCDGLVMLNLGRIARLLTVQEAALAMVWQAGGQVFMVEEGEIVQDDDLDPMRTAMRQMMGVFHQLDRAMIVARLRSARQLKHQQGGYAGHGSPPYGWHTEEHELVPDPAEQRALARMCELHQAGLSLRQIGATLDLEGHRPRRARGWSPMAVSRALARTTT